MAFPSSAQLLSIIMVIVASLVLIEANQLEFDETDKVEPLHRHQREFDYFALALQWPGTYCRSTRHCCSQNACCRGSKAPTEFTIHGLWPDYNDGTWPACCTAKKFEEKEISTLLDGLQKYWPSLSCGSPSNCHGGKGSFWGHEWEKHGTCSYPVLRDEYNYFVTGLNLYFKYNVTRVLFEEGYKPSNSEKYPRGGIIAAIQNAFHSTPELVCRNGALEELRICFYKDFKPLDCLSRSTMQSDSVSSKGSCPDYISLPEMSLGVESWESTRSWVSDEVMNEDL